MLVKSFAQRLLVLFGFSCLTVLLLLAMWTGLLGIEYKFWLASNAAPAEIFYRNNEPAVTTAFRLLGYFGTGLMGLWSLHKAYYFSEWNLPERIEAYIQQISNRKALTEREQLIKVAEAATSMRLAPSTGWITRYNERRTIQHWEEIAGSIDEMFRQYKSEQNVLNAALTNLNKQFATAHYLNGLYECDKLKSIKSFEAAADLDANDTRALESAATEAMKLHDYNKAIELWNKLGNAFDTRGDHANFARALRRQAQCSSSRSDDPSLTRGARRRYFVTAKELAERALQKLGELKFDDTANLQFAETYELLGEVKARLGTNPSARIALGEALQRYTALKKFKDAQRVKKSIEELA